MDQARLKYRIVGGIVLLALAAILVPLLSEVRQPLPRGAQTIDIPAEPVGGVSAQLPADGELSHDAMPQLQRPPEPLPAPPPSGEGDAVAPAENEPVPPSPIAPFATRPAPQGQHEPAAPPAAVSVPAKTAKPSKTAPVATPGLAAAPAHAASGAKELAAVVKPAGGATAAPAAVSAPKAVTPVPIKPPAAGGAVATSVVHHAWVVQLGVYGNVKTAIDLREKLRKAGYSAFTEEVATPNGKALRVRVGPDLDRSVAQALRDRLAREMGHDGIVMAYP